jgi:phosphatidylserine/phosphatidylglycerophosphate/cardiolipin synthase-like enzyme
VGDTTMSLNVTNTAATGPGPTLRPLQRRSEAPAPAQTPKGDQFVATAKGPASPKALVPLRIDGATVIAPGGKAPTLAATFDAIPTAGGGAAKVRLLPRNTDAWNARWDMLTSAKTSIDASYFSLEKDVYGYAFLGALLKKQMDGVPVRVMTDGVADGLGARGFTTPGRGRDYLQELVNHGGKAYAYNPITNRPLELLRADYSVLSSNHDKVLVVDGKRGITGGRNIGIDYLTEPADRKGAWRDMDVEMTGAGPAKGLQAAFDAEVGTGKVAKPVYAETFNWSKKDVQLIGAYEMMNIWLNDPAMSAADKAATRKNPAAMKALAADLVNRAVAKINDDLPPNLRRKPDSSDMEKLNELATQLTEQLEARGSRKAYLANTPADHAGDVKIIDKTSKAAAKTFDGIGPALKKMVESAQKHIVIENPYVVLTEDMMKALESASKRGVKIDIITNSPLSTDSAVTQAFFLEDWQNVLARCDNARIFVATGGRKFHTKSAVADGEQAFVSTYNLDLLSNKVNSEVGAVVRSKELASDLLREFDNDKADPANGFLEYTIKKDADGKAILKDGKPVPQFGPENHLPADVLEVYRGKRKTWGHTLRDNLPYFKPLRHPATIMGQ